MNEHHINLSKCPSEEKETKPFLREKKNYLFLVFLSYCFLFNSFIWISFFDNILPIAFVLNVKHIFIIS
jgi:hypothetical protein